MKKAFWLGNGSNQQIHRLLRYFFYAIGEIILVVIGILIALKINNWNADRLEKKNEIQIYLSIKQQILEDKLELEKVIEMNDNLTRQFELANKIILEEQRQKIDTLAVITMMLSQHSDFHRNSNIYETLVNSGDLKLLKNQDIVGHLQQLELIYTQLKSSVGIHWDIILEELSPEVRGVINYTTLEFVEPEKLFGVVIQNFFVASIYLMKGKTIVYQQAIAEIDAIINLVERATK